MCYLIPGCQLEGGGGGGGGGDDVLHHCGCPEEAVTGPAVYRYCMRQVGRQWILGTLYKCYMSGVDGRCTC